MMPSLTELTGPQHQTAPGDSRATLGNRQLAAVLFMGLLLVSLIASLSYLVGRLSGPADAVKAQTQARKGMQEQVIVVDPIVGNQHAKPSPPSPIKVPPPQPVTVSPPSPKPQPAPPVAAAKPATPPIPHPAFASATPPGLAGSSFFQVAAVDRGMAEVSVEFLRKKDLPALLGDIASPGVYRVLVGPLNTIEETNRVKASLENAGFHPFLRKY
jgi:cell division septation protein DedD